MIAELSVAAALSLGSSAAAAALAQCAPEDHDPPPPVEPFHCATTQRRDIWPNGAVAWCSNPPGFAHLDVLCESTIVVGSQTWRSGEDHFSVWDPAPHQVPVTCPISHPRINRAVLSVTPG